LIVKKVNTLAAFGVVLTEIPETRHASVALSALDVFLAVAPAGDKIGSRI
jgi:hypothetical protein